MAMSLSRVLLCVAVATLSLSAASVAQDKSPPGAVDYTPSLGDLMAAVQLRHAKLWYAGSFRNWPLAEYELGQLRSNLREAARLHAKMPATDLAGADKSAALVDEAIKSQSSAKFDTAFGQMTAACNNCHQAADRRFILVRVPTRSSPFSNQAFAP
jgi:cytochrome c553